MKKFIIVVIALLYSFIGVNIVFAAPDTWTRKADFGGTVRYSTVSFSIGDKGYIGTGYGYTPQTGTQRTKDFWEYDPANDTWTQKADFGGAARTSAAGFSVGGKGYIGTGNVPPTSNVKDFWEYDPALNVWTRKADFGGGNRIGAVGFSIGNKGYIGWGINSSANYKDFWEYDPATNIWTKKADFGGTARSDVVGFSIGNKGYVGTGLYYNYTNSSSTYYKDFWEYDPAKDIWTQKTDFGGATRYRAAGFSIGNKGYIGVGKNSSNQTDFWQYDPDTNAWTKKADFGGGSRVDPAVFVIGYKGYVGTGIAGLATYTKDFWEYEPAEISAVLIQKDLFTAGDGLLTHDTISGLDWLDVSLTVNQNYDDVRTGIWYQRGFRHATREEVENLFIHAGTPDDWFDPAVTYPEETLRLMNLLGTTGDSRTYGLCGTDYLGNLITLETHPIGVSFSALLGKLDYILYDDMVLGEAHFTQGHPFSDERSPDYGSFLVRQPGDTTPDPFTFNYEVDVDLNTVITSNTITVTGISAPSPISITGGTYSINGDTYTSANGIVNNGDKVTVQQTSSGSYMTTTVATLTIGGVSDAFSVTTKEASVITLSPVANKTVLWPPNNKMVLITIKANASDSSGGPVTLKATVSCNEPAKRGQDWTEPVINQKTGIISLSLRATRLGSGTDRIYTIAITATGTEGNAATKAVTITVPHDQSNNKVNNKVRR